MNRTPTLPDMSTFENSRMYFLLSKVMVVSVFVIGRGINEQNQTYVKKRDSYIYPITVFYKREYNVQER